MSPNVTTVLAAAESLTITERRELIELLIAGVDESASADETAPDLSEAWKEEIVRRSAEYDAGRAETVSWQEVKERWQSRRAPGG